MRERLLIKKLIQVNFLFIDHTELELLKKIGSTIIKYKEQQVSENANTGKEGKKKRRKKKWIYLLIII